MPISVLIVDDHALLRESLRVMLEATTDFDVVGEAKDGVEALIMVERLHPDVVVLDYMMPNMDGVEGALWLRKQRPETHVLILSMYNDESYVSTAIQNGANGYILKDDAITHLAPGITAAAAGQFYFSPSLRGLAV